MYRSFEIICETIFKCKICSIVMCIMEPFSFPVVLISRSIIRSLLVWVHVGAGVGLGVGVGVGAGAGEGVWLGTGAGSGEGAGIYYLTQA